MRNTDCWKICREKCTDDALADSLYKILKEWFYLSWESILKDLANGSITSKADVDEVFHENW